MKVLHIGKFYHPTRGGMETVVKSLAEGLQQSGLDITVLCAGINGQNPEDLINSVKVVRSKALGTLFSQPLAPQLPKTIHQMREKFDLVHIHSPNPLVEAATLTLPGGPPVLVTYHSDVVRQKFALPFYAPLLKRFLNHVSSVIVATEYHIRHSLFLPAVQDKCKIIPFGLDPSHFRLNSEVATRVMELRGKYGRFILFIGRLVGYKGLPILLEAMTKLNTRLVIIGDGPLRSILQSTAAEFGVHDKVSFLGQVDDPIEMLAHLHACDLFVLPSISRTEAFGMVLLEAMACGKPLITTKLSSGVRFVNEDGVTGLHVTPGDAEGMAASIRKLLADDELRMKMGQSALHRFRRLFTRDRMISSHHEVYESMAGRIRKAA